MKKLKRMIALFVASLSMPLATAIVPVAAADTFTLTPREFVGTAEQCGTEEDAPDIITSEWVDGTGNPEPAILLEKNGSTATCAAAVVDIDSALVGGDVSGLTELGFDYQDGGHCNNGAPRFNVNVDGTDYFFGCTFGIASDSGTEGWTRITFDQATLGATLPDTGTIDSISIVFDEGTDTPLPEAVTAGSVYIDNVNINGARVGEPEEEEPVVPASKDDCKKGGWQNYNGMFRNQGDCVSFVATQGRNQPGLANNPRF